MTNAITEQSEQSVITNCVICGKELTEQRIAKGKETCCKKCAIALTYNIKRKEKLEAKKSYAVTHCVICGKELTEYQILHNRTTCCISCGNKRYFNSLTEMQKAELRKKNSEAVKAAFQKPEVKEKHSKALVKAFAKRTDEQKQAFRATMSNAMKLNWTKDSYRQTKSEQVHTKSLELWQNNDYRNKQKQSHAWMKTDETFKDFHRQRTSEGTKAALASPEKRRKISNGIKRAYKLNGAAITKKINDTKKLRAKANTSETENYGFNLLKQVFPDVIRHYISDVYPFNCDYYVPSKDLYIEGHFHWTHGKRPYDSTIKECQERLLKWKERADGHPWYSSAIKNWTYRDVLKRQTAKANNLNFVEVFSIQELINTFNIKEI